ncbi:hypothetical protein PPL_06919 [Heterostelium album PN500]|uniref:Uncharacterized protein n=1 Tax=Heterostelium pallidum (strain ATCC 26659 / Pp 5 / PN500) TaxID=670386 RepID=D3BDW6_HETP5|nr:hypothetical protein PPL_06919 [Heterostelium album PN500]EFA80097.1 hypothetical protein PPL_06919 [Heterostelium album PN500]|eukprot:XP_020432217.1 hypothetical protein PPL_06919 [Heterostelium album PN500]
MNKDYRKYLLSRLLSSSYLKNIIFDNISLIHNQLSLDVVIGGEFEKRCSLLEMLRYGRSDLFLDYFPCVEQPMLDGVTEGSLNKMFLFALNLGNYRVLKFLFNKYKEEYNRQFSGRCQSSISILDWGVITPNAVKRFAIESSNTLFDLFISLLDKPIPQSIVYELLEGLLVSKRLDRIEIVKKHYNSQYLQFIFEHYYNDICKFINNSKDNNNNDNNNNNNRNVNRLDNYIRWFGDLKNDSIYRVSVEHGWSYHLTSALAIGDLVILEPLLGMLRDRPELFTQTRFSEAAAHGSVVIERLLLVNPEIFKNRLVYLKAIQLDRLDSYIYLVQNNITHGEIDNNLRFSLSQGTSLGIVHFILDNNDFSNLTTTIYFFSNIHRDIISQVLIEKLISKGLKMSRMELFQSVISSMNIKLLDYIEKLDQFPNVIGNINYNELLVYCYRAGNLYAAQRYLQFVNPETPFMPSHEYNMKSKPSESQLQIIDGHNIHLEIFRLIVESNIAISLALDKLMIETSLKYDYRYNFRLDYIHPNSITFIKEVITILIRNRVLPIDQLLQLVNQCTILELPLEIFILLFSTQPDINHTIGHWALSFSRLVRYGRLDVAEYLYNRNKDFIKHFEMFVVIKRSAHWLSSIIKLKPMSIDYQAIVNGFLNFGDSQIVVFYQIMEHLLATVYHRGFPTEKINNITNLTTNNQYKTILYAIEKNLFHEEKLKSIYLIARMYGHIHIIKKLKDIVKCSKHIG